MPGYNYHDYTNFKYGYFTRVTHHYESHKVIILVEFQNWIKTILGGEKH